MDVLKIRLNILAHITVLLLSIGLCITSPSLSKIVKRNRKMSGQEQSDEPARQPHLHPANPFNDDQYT